MSHNRIGANLGSLITSGAMLLLATPGRLRLPGRSHRSARRGLGEDHEVDRTAGGQARRHADDVTFMRDTIHHHDQAVRMAERVKDRTNLPELVAVAARINASQSDEAS